MAKQLVSDYIPVKGVVASQVGPHYLPIPCHG